MRSDADEEFTEFVRARQHALVRFGYLLTGDQMMAEDLPRPPSAGSISSGTRSGRRGSRRRV
ncbi:MAG TPA: hypothetical protein VFY88_11415 [Intrasporangium sp.]|nr:hypothetical protein [Intrasporangium sp.]